MHSLAGPVKIRRQRLGVLLSFNSSPPFQVLWITNKIERYRPPSLTEHIVGEIYTDREVLPPLDH